MPPPPPRSCLCRHNRFFFPQRRTGKKENTKKPFIFLKPFRRCSNEDRNLGLNPTPLPRRKTPQEGHCQTVGNRPQDRETGLEAGDFLSHASSAKGLKTRCLQG